MELKNGDLLGNTQLRGGQDNTVVLIGFPVVDITPGWVVCSTLVGITMGTSVFPVMPKAGYFLVTFGFMLLVCLVLSYYMYGASHHVYG